MVLFRSRRLYARALPSEGTSRRSSDGMQRGARLSHAQQRLGKCVYVCVCVGGVAGVHALSVPRNKRGDGVWWGDSARGGKKMSFWNAYRPWKSRVSSLLLARPPKGGEVLCWLFLLHFVVEETERRGGEDLLDKKRLVSVCFFVEGCFVYSARGRKGEMQVRVSVQK